MKQEQIYPHYVTNEATVGNNFEAGIDSRLRVQNYFDALGVTYTEMSTNDSNRQLVYVELLAVSEYLKTNGGNALNARK